MTLCIGEVALNGPFEGIFLHRRSEVFRNLYREGSVVLVDEKDRKGNLLAMRSKVKEAWASEGVGKLGVLPCE